MASICSRCALRLRRAAQSEIPQSSRLFSASAAPNKSLPTFHPTSSPELDAVLNTIRTKHFLPAALDPSKRRLIFQTKHQQTLIDNPQTATFAGEEIPLQWMDRRTEIPVRRKLIKEAVELMAKSKAGRDWENLPGLLEGLQTCSPKPPKLEMVEFVVRKAVAAGHTGVILKCLERHSKTSLTLKLYPSIVRALATGIHNTALSAKWSEEGIAKALGQARLFSHLLESPDHGSGHKLTEDDPRKNPAIIGVFLSLSAAHTRKSSSPSKSSKATVHAYVERLLATLGPLVQPMSFAPPKAGPVWEMLESVPIWQGLALAREVLGDGCPENARVSVIEADYHAALRNLAAALEAQEPKEGTYGSEALKVWNGALRA